MNIRLVILIIICSVNVSYAQVFERTIDWLPNRPEILNDKKIELLSFSNVVYENISTGLPYYFEKISINKGFNDTKIYLLSSEFENVPDDLLKNVENLENIPVEFSLNSSIVTEKKMPSVELSFIPLRRNITTGKIERLVHFSFKKTDVNNLNKNINARIYAANSVFSSGKWIKLKVSQTGMYKLTYSQISALGFQNPEKVKIYGNGGKVLPIYNSSFRYDDVVENPIIMEKGQDGIFNQGDYILFYAHGPVYWMYDNVKGYYIHSLHPYSDEAYYFITDEGNYAKAIEMLPLETATPNQTVTEYDDFAYHESESVNFLKSGKLWVGENFNIILDYDIPFSFSNIVQGQNAKIIASLYGRSSVSNSFNISCNGSTLGTATISATSLASVSSNYANNTVFVNSFPATSGTFNANVAYNKPAQGGEGWLDYMVINVRRNLVMQGGQIQFRDKSTVSVGNVTEYQISNANSNTKVLDVTNPVNPHLVQTTLNGNVLSFVSKSDTLHEYLAFDNTMFLATVNVGEIANQNLHATPATDMVIVSHPDFIGYAKTLADHHTTFDNLSVLVVTPELIYNEFSSGAPDPTAIKDFMKMLYDRAGTDTSLMPKYLLLYGDGSFDNRHNFSGNTNFILTYESNSSLSPTNSFTTDDYFGMLDDSEGDYIGVLDIGVGRFPVKTSSEAQGVLNKILNYVKASCNGDWKNWLTFIGDDEDSNEHMYQSNSLCSYLDTAFAVYNIDKIFLDAFPQMTTPNGDRYPDVNVAIANRIKKGTFIINYTGHGNEVGLAHEHIIGVSDINSWTNINRLPLFITATCEFSRYDDFERTSAGEMVFLNPSGGAVSMFTTTRLVYSNSNFVMNQAFIRTLFSKDGNGNYYHLGDIYRIAKNATSSAADVNKRNFSLLGDPALKLGYPKYIIVTDSINGIPVNTFNDTIKALQKITIKGHIQKQDGSLVNNYNGVIYSTVFDKFITMTTLANDGGNKFSFKTQNNILYKGKASITNSIFEFTFVVPRDIQYAIGPPKFSYYADDNTIYDAHGYTNTLSLGGNSSGSISDNVGPKIELYMNDDNFVFGGITDENPDIYAKLSDDNGINTVGNGIGHDLTAILDENTNKTIVLNDYYEGELNDYQSGVVRYPLSLISSGQHTLKMKAWDVCNNSSEATTEFVVAESQSLTLGNVFNYPNPFTTSTDFYFDHNQPNSDLSVLIQVFTITGKLVKTINPPTINSNSFHSTPIHWDGLDDFGDKIGKGVYLYKLTVKTMDDMKEEKYEKLVILR